MREATPIHAWSAPERSSLMHIVLLCFLLLPFSDCTPPSSENVNNSSSMAEMDFPFPTLLPWVAVYLPKNGSFIASDRQCVEDSKLLKKSFDSRVLWAVRMVDASVRQVTGALWGSHYQLGSFDACLNAGGGSPVGAQYCLIRVSAPLQAPMNQAPIQNWASAEELGPYEDARAVINGAGLLPGFYRPGDVLVAQCVPASCRPAALEAALRASLGPGRATVSPSHCTRPGEEDGQRSHQHLLFWGFLATLVVVSIAAPYLGWSWWDWQLHLRALARPDPHLEGLNLAALSGIRCLTATLLIFLHRAELSIIGATSNQPVTLQTLTSFSAAPIFHGQIFNSTFLFLSGVLTIMCKTKHGVLRSLLIRLFRFLPLYLTAIVFTSAILPGLGSGPLWKHFVYRESEACVNRWWANILFLNNFVPVSSEARGCLFTTWYLAAEMQLLLTCLLLRPRERSWRALLLALLLSVLPTLIGTLRYDWPVLAPNRPLHVEVVYDDHWFVYGYIPVYMRATAFIVGLIAGKALLELKKKDNFHLSAAVTWLATVGSVLFMSGLLLCSTVLLHPHRPYSALEAAVFASLSPAAWSGALAVLLVALVFGVHTWVHTLLSWQALVTLSRLSYGLHLFSFIIQVAFLAAQTDAKKVTSFTVLQDGASDVALFFPLSFALHILVEAPFRSVAKELLDRKVEMNGVLGALTPPRLKKEL